MAKVIIEKGQKINFPKICPYCGQSGVLVRLPVGSFFNEDDESKLRLPMHRKCWRERATRLFIYAGSLLAISILVALYFFPGIERLAGVITFIVLYLILHTLFPTPIEVSFEKDTIELNIRNIIYRDEFVSLNELKK